MRVLGEDGEGEHEVGEERDNLQRLLSKYLQLLQHKILLYRQHQILFPKKPLPISIYPRHHQKKKKNKYQIHYLFNHKI